MIKWRINYHMTKSKKFSRIGVATLIIIIAYSIILYIYFENTIPGMGLGLSYAQATFLTQLVYIIPIGLGGIGLIYWGNRVSKNIDVLAKSPVENIRNYFSDRIKEIEDGVYVPTYEQVKGLPEFNEVNRENFRNARRKWYLYNFGMSFVKFNAQLEKVK